MTAVLARLRTRWSSWDGRCGAPTGFYVEFGGTRVRLHCAAPMSRLRWVLVGRCGQHGGRRG